MFALNPKLLYFLVVLDYALHASFPIDLLTNASASHNIDYFSLRTCLRNRPSSLMIISLSKRLTLFWALHDMYQHEIRFKISMFSLQSRRTCFLFQIWSPLLCYLCKLLIMLCFTNAFALILKFSHCCFLLYLLHKYNIWCCHFESMTIHTSLGHLAFCSRFEVYSLFSLQSCNYIMFY